MKNIIKTGLMMFAVASLFISCKEWTEPEAVGNRYDTIKEVDPDAYSVYLSKIRDYRNVSHKKVYAWFDNKASFVSQADHVASVPDSIDVLVLGNPRDVNQSILNEMDTKRSETGMQMAYTIDYAVIRKAWENNREQGSTEAWSSFMKNTLTIGLELFDNGGFDRLICAYDGKDMSAYTPAEKSEYLADQEAFLKPFMEWQKSHLDKGFDFVGIPVNVADKSVLDAAGTIFLSETLNSTNVDDMAYIVMRNTVEGVPAAKFAVMSSLPVLDPTQASLGYWGNAYSSWLTARWARTAKVAAIGLVNLYDDYYNPTFIYPVCRGAIQILNPAAR